jgi:hypothetical protein
MCAEHQTSRRLFLAAGSASAVFGALAQAAAASTMVDDPIFAAIERHRAAWRALSTAQDIFDEALQNGTSTEDVRERCSVADEEEFEALNALSGTSPTTKEGLRAALEYMSYYYRDGVSEETAVFCASLLRSPVLAVSH